MRASLLPLSPPILKKCAGCSRISCSDFMVGKPIRFSFLRRNSRGVARSVSTAAGHPVLYLLHVPPLPPLTVAPSSSLPLRLSVLDLCCRGGSRQFSGDNVLASNEERKEESRTSEGRRQESTGGLVGRNQTHRFGFCDIFVKRCEFLRGREERSGESRQR